MIDRTFVVDVELRPDTISLGGDTAVQPKRKLALFSLVMLVGGCLAMLILGIMTVARIGSIPQLADLPQTHLPGNALPEDVSCYMSSNEYVPRCSAYVPVLGKEVYFEFDVVTRIVRSTLVPALEYTLGQLILSWGTPSGIVQTSRTTYIYWGTRSAVLYTGALRPDSRVQFILYEIEPQAASPWRGFRRRNG